MTTRPTSEHPESSSTSPRQRVQQHLRKLVVSGAVTSAALKLSACECLGCNVVCDPLPPPQVCPSADGGSSEASAVVKATWQSLDAGLVASVRVWANNSASELTGAGDPTLQGATLVSSTPSSNLLADFTCRVDASATAVHVNVPVNCSHARDNVRFDLNVAGARTPGNSIEVSFP